MAESLVQTALRKLGPEGLVKQLSPEALATLRRSWEAWARPEQQAPPGRWRTWFVLAGRGFGKSRTGAEWCRRKALEMPGSHGALIAATAADARDVMALAMTSAWNGGLLDERDPGMPIYEPSKRKLTWKNGSTATLYSAEKPDRLRGPQHHWGWGDEIAAWQYRDAWDQFQFGLRLGDCAQACVTSTPRPIELIKQILKEATTVVSHGSTFDNHSNLDRYSLAELRRRYDGTRLGRQELYGHVLEDIEGALWSHDLIDLHRLRISPGGFRRIVVAIDPAGSAKKTADEAGIIVAGISDRGGRSERQGFLLEDLTGRYSPRDMIARAIAAYHHWGADRLVAEDNFGGQMIHDLVTLTDPTVAYRSVHASRGKIVRAEPVAALYEQGRIHHVGLFRELEDEMCSYAPLLSTISPGRMDALVWAITDLMLGESPVETTNDGWKPPPRAFSSEAADDGWGD